MGFIGSGDSLQLLGSLLIGDPEHWMIGLDEFKIPRVVGFPKIETGSIVDTTLGPIGGFLG